MMSEPPGGFDSLMPPGERLKRPVSVPVSSLLASGGVWIFCLVAAFIIGRCSADEEPAPLSKALLAPLQSLTAPQNTAPAQATAVDKPCWVVRNAAKWAPLANKDVPFDMYTTPEGQLELGFAVDEQNARGFSLDPKSLTAEEVFSEEESKERVITRVTPVGRDKGGFFVLSRSAEEDDSSAALPVPADQPFFVRFSGGKALVGPSVEEATTEIWPLGGGDAEITAARTLPTRTGNHVITFRQDGRIFAGYVDGTGKAVGSLGEIAGSGGKVGRPKAGVNGKELAVAFADLPKGDGARWQMRIGRAELGQLPTTATVLEFPAGGPGGDAFAPDMVGLPDGRWLVMWTEGTGPGQRAVRAQTYDPELNPIGDPIALSPPAGSFGQAVLGVVGTYTAAVFLSLGDSGFELYGAVLQCGS